MTASAAFDASRALGEFDISQLRIFRDMAERHLGRALAVIGNQRSLLAAADPNQFIEADMLDEFFEVAFAAWDDGYSLVLSLLDLPAPTTLYSSLVATGVHNAAGHYQDLLNTLIGDKAFKTLREPIFGEFLKGNLVQYGDIRPMLITLGGGSPEPVAPMMGGITSGRTMKSWLGENGIAADKKIWLYGYEDEPRRTFNGHLQMDGLVFEDWEDEGLEVAPQDYWLRRSHYQVGDHWGCACVIAPYIPNFGGEYTIDI